MMKNVYLQEAFKALDILNEEDFNLSSVDGLKDAKEFIDTDEKSDFIDIIDPEAETEEEIKDSYVGDVILDCCVCHSKLYKHPDEVNISEEANLANIDEECPFCYSTDGYEIIGMVAPYEEEEDEEVEIDDDEEVEDAFDESFKRRRKLREEFDEEIWYKLPLKVQERLNSYWNTDTNNRVFKPYLTALADIEVLTLDEVNTLLKSNIEDGYANTIDESFNNLKEEFDESIWYKLPLKVQDRLSSYWDENADNTVFKPYLTALADTGVITPNEVTILLKSNIEDGYATTVDESFKRTRKLKEEFSEEIWNKLPSPIKNSLNIAWDSNKSSKWFDAYLTALVDANILDEKDKKEIIQSNIEDGFEEEVEEGLGGTLLGGAGGAALGGAALGPLGAIGGAALGGLAGNILTKNESLNEDRLDNFLSSDEIYNIMSKNTGFGDFESYNILDNMIIKTSSSDFYPGIGPHGAYHVEDRYWKVFRDDNGNFKVFELSDIDGDQIGEPFFLTKNKKIKEHFEKVEIETDKEKMEMTSEPNGKTIITTEPKNSDEEMIVPVSDEVQSEINPINEPDEPNEDEFADIEVDEFSEDEFNELGESYLKKVYENVNSFKTSKVKTSGNKLVIEGIIGFNSGKEKKTSFVFESKDVNKKGRVRFIGENLQLSRGKKAFTVTGKINKGKFIAESLNYNYRTKDSTGKSTRLYGTVRTSK